MIPINNRYIVERYFEEDKTNTIQIPQSIQQKSSQIGTGIIKKVPKVITGKGIEIESPLKEGDKVLFSIYCHQTRELGQEPVFYPNINEIIAVIE